MTGNDVKVGFQVGGPANRLEEAPKSRRSVCQLYCCLSNLVDLVDMGVQRTEFDILAAASGSRAQKVKRVHVETHSGQVLTDIYRLFRTLGWKAHFLFEGNSADKTPWGHSDS